MVDSTLMCANYSAELQFICPKIKEYPKVNLGRFQIV